MALKGIGSHEGGDGEAPIVAEINITPLTDIFLVLLIIFMVTSSVMSQQGMDVNLPKASSGTSDAQPEGVIVTLLPGGKMVVNQKELAAGKYSELEQELRSSFKQTSSRLVILEGDREAFLGSAIAVMDHAKKAGAQKFAIATTESQT